MKTHYYLFFGLALLAAALLLVTRSGTERATARATAEESQPAATSMPRNGPALALMPRVGISKIRFGATMRGIERRMGVACTVATESTCLYPEFGLSFELDSGGLARIVAHREGRLMPGADQLAGRGNATISPRLYAGDPVHRAEEAYGAPVQRSPLSGPSGQYERLEYTDLALEFDRLNSGDTVIGAIELSVAARK